RLVAIAYYTVSLHDALPISNPRPSPYEGAALSAAPRSRDVSVRESGDVEMWAGPGAHTSSPMRGEEAGCLPRESNPDASWHRGLNPGASTCSARRADPGPAIT